MRNRIALVLATALALGVPGIPSARASCPSFGPIRNLGKVDAPELNEISGVVVSRAHPGVLWVHEDSNNEAAVYALSRSGHLLGKVTLTGATNRDWEDIAIAHNTLYVGDIGDNGRKWPSIVIYRFPEPAARNGMVHPQSLTLKYEDGNSYNAEAMFVTPSNDLFVVTKLSGRALVFRTSAAIKDGGSGTLRKIATLAIDHATAADISATAIIVKNGESGYLYPRSGTVAETLSQTPCSEPVRKGEAVGFDPKRGGYYMIPEGRDAPVSYAPPG